MRNPKFHLLTFLLFSFFINASSLSAQTTDNILWAGVQVKQKLNDKTLWAAKPILRLNDNLSAYQNWSIDVMIQHKFTQQLSARFLHRTWFLPDEVYRHFFWFDLMQAKTVGAIKWSNQIRFHYAADVGERRDGDFIRFQTQVALMNLGKVRPFIGVEPWFQMNDFQRWQRARYQIGISYQLSQQWSVSSVLWREEWWNNAPNPNFNIWLLTLAYQLPNAKG